MKKYQIFLSSSFNEFKNERNKLVEEILKQDEYFPIALENALAYNNTVDMLYSFLSQSDIYVLLIGYSIGSNIGQRGAERLLEIADNEHTNLKELLNQYTNERNISTDKISFTEMEYLIAKSLQLPIISFVKKDVLSSMETAEDTLFARFYNEIRSIGAFNQWDDINVLIRDVINSLHSHIKQHPETIGWIRETEGEIYKSSTSIGIISVHGNGNIDKRKFQEHLLKSTELKLYFTTGVGFVRAFHDLLVDFVANGGKIKLLCMKSKSDSLKGVELIESIKNTHSFSSGIRSDIHNEYTQIKNEFKRIINDAKQQNRSSQLGEISIGFCETLFRSTITICEHNDDNRDYNELWGWFTITLPPKPARTSASLELSCKYTTDKIPTDNLLYDSLDHFNYSWKIAKKKKHIIIIK